ncbi:ATP-grasp domain-containing protein [Paenibacillus cymbidii]|uniref:ATP-grasp domain-containing protein n=1 Tax=Paenibacillus cymbidii TaxID=1639034 RepID=UPI001436A2C8|nr:hypothetical protein [Paenibacillus cymbidii]
MKKILVANTGERVYAKQLIQRADVQATFITEARFVDAYPEGTDIIVVDNLNEPALTAQSVLTQCDAGMYDAVISLSERAAPAAAYLRDYLGLGGASVRTVLNCTNKFAMKRRFSAAGLRSAQFQLASTPEEAVTAAKKLGWPVIIKPVMGSGSDMTMVFENEDVFASIQGQEYFQKLTNPATTSAKRFPVIVESFLKVSSEYHCDGFVRNGTVVFARVSRYIRPVLEFTAGIHGSFLLNKQDPMAGRILDIHQQAVLATGIENGVTHFEIMQTDEDLFAGEIACRPGGGGIRRMIELQSGFDVWAAYLAASLNEEYKWEEPESVTAGKQIAEFMLPVKLGTVKAVSTASDFSGVPGYIEANMKIKSGDTVDGLIDSGAISGIVFAWIDEHNRMEEVMRKIEAVFFLEMDTH